LSVHDGDDFLPSLPFTAGYLFQAIRDCVATLPPLTRLAKLSHSPRGLRPGLTARRRCAAISNRGSWVLSHCYGVSPNAHSHIRPWLTLLGSTPFIETAVNGRSDNWQLATDPRLVKERISPSPGAGYGHASLTLIRSDPSFKVRAELRIVKITKVQVR